jgi:hypothetical protein
VSTDVSEVRALKILSFILAAVRTRNLTQIKGNIEVSSKALKKRNVSVETSERIESAGGS